MKHVLSVRNAFFRERRDFCELSTGVVPFVNFFNPLNPTGLETGWPETNIYPKGRYTGPHTYHHYPAGLYIGQYYSGAQRVKINMQGCRGYRAEWLGRSGFKGLKLTVECVSFVVCHTLGHNRWYYLFTYSIVYVPVTHIT